LFFFPVFLVRTVAVVVAVFDLLPFHHGLHLQQHISQHDAMLFVLFLAQSHQVVVVLFDAIAPRHHYPPHEVPDHLEKGAVVVRSSGGSSRRRGGTHISGVNHSSRQPQQPQHKQQQQQQQPQQQQPQQQQSVRITHCVFLVPSDDLFAQQQPMVQDDVLVHRCSVRFVLVMTNTKFNNLFV